MSTSDRRVRPVAGQVAGYPRSPVDDHAGPPASGPAPGIEGIRDHAGPLASRPAPGIGGTGPPASRPAPGIGGVHAPPSGVDSSRRRFLRQLAAGSGAVGLGIGLPRPGSAQEPAAPDFSILAEHEHAAAEPSNSMPARARRARGTEEGSGELARSEPEAWITENRALWVEPAYLILLQWSRPQLDLEPVEALEGSVGVITAYLTSAGATSEGLHDTESLAALEQGLVALLAPTVAPAVIEVVHLDHDCQALCPEVDPPPHIRGRMVTPTR